MRFVSLIVSLALVAGCSAQSPTNGFALRGTLLTPNGIVENGIVLVQNGVIVGVGQDVPLPAGWRAIETHGVIAPGLIDLHNHLTWNVTPRWKPNTAFGNRYDWQQTQVYGVTVAGVHNQMVADGLECALERYAEVKALTEGETSVTGSLNQPCSDGLARNLDVIGASGGLRTVAYNVFPLQMNEDQLAKVKADLASRAIGGFLIHLAEGAPRDAAANREFAMLKGRGLLLPGVSLIHGVGLKAPDFAEMKRAGVGLVWSPRSNIELYGETVDMAAAKASGVTIALAPDWSINGSDGSLGELTWASLWSKAYGNLFTDQQIVQMATANAAELAGLGDTLGSLKVGYRADLLVVASSLPGEVPIATHDAWWTLTHATPAQVELVTINGEPLYGATDLLTKLGLHAAEPLEMCGTRKGLVLAGKQGQADAASPNWAATSQSLSDAMQHYGRRLAPLAECGN